MRTGVKDSQDFKHGLNGYNAQKCRCDVCVDGHTEYHRNYRLRLVERLDELPPSAHGKLNTYKNFSCRCDLCRRAASDDHQRRRERKQVAKLRTAPGSVSREEERVKFYAVRNDIIGGWGVAIEDKPMSEMDGRLGHKVICELVLREDAELIARLLTDQWESGWRWRLAEGPLGG